MRAVKSPDSDISSLASASSISCACDHRSGLLLAARYSISFFNASSSSVRMTKYQNPAMVWSKVPTSKIFFSSLLKRLS